MYARSSQIKLSQFYAVLFSNKRKKSSSCLPPRILVAFALPEICKNWRLFLTYAVGLANFGRL
jgi:hypothetical protein